MLAFTEAPANQDHPVSEAGAQPPDRGWPCRGGFQPVEQKFLVVDDNRDICQLVSEMLSGTRAQIFQATNGTDAVGILEHRPIDLAIVDLLFAGPISSDMVVQLAKLKQCRVITMSGTLASDRRGRDLGTPHLVKPFRAEQLVNLVETTLAQSGQSPVVL
jgi:DNA-binding response OmpR family regulator